MGHLLISGPWRRITVICTGLPLRGSSPSSTPGLRATTSPCGTVLHCAWADAPVRAGRDSRLVRLRALAYACPCAGPLDGVQGDSGPGGATGSFLRRLLGWRASALAAGRVVSDASGFGAPASGPSAKPNVRLIQF